MNFTLMFLRYMNVYACLLFFSFFVICIYSSVYIHLLVFIVGDKHLVLLFLCCCMFLPTLNKYLLTYYLVCVVDVPASKDSEFMCPNHRKQGEMDNCHYL